MSEAKSVEVTPPRKIRVDLHESKLKAPNPPKGKTYDKPTWVCHFCGKSGHIRLNSFLFSLFLGYVLHYIHAFDSKFFFFSFNSFQIKINK